MNVIALKANAFKKVMFIRITRGFSVDCLQIIALKPINKNNDCSFQLGISYEN
jgi:hypothetical protein